MYFHAKYVCVCVLFLFAIILLWHVHGPHGSWILCRWMKKLPHPQLLLLALCHRRTWTRPLTRLGYNMTFNVTCAMHCMHVRLCSTIPSLRWSNRPMVSHPLCSMKCAPSRRRVWQGAGRRRRIKRVGKGQRKLELQERWKDSSSSKESKSRFRWIDQALQQWEAQDCHPAPHERTEPKKVPSWPWHLTWHWVPAQAQGNEEAPSSWQWWSLWQTSQATSLSRTGSTQGEGENQQG